MQNVLFKIKGSNYFSENISPEDFKAKRKQIKKNCILHAFLVKYTKQVPSQSDHFAEELH